MVERHMNPLNAYLNTMHVKTDVMRVELDSVGERLPKLARSIGDVGQQLKQTEAVLAAKNVTIQQDAQTLSDSLAECLLRVEENYGELGTSIAGVSKDLGDQLHELRSRLLGTAQAVEAMKAEELSGLARELLTLEQKVAKWVHAHPLPAKISEARLYSLEARLAEEMDQRMMFETKVRSKGLITPRGNGMPQVQNMGMWQSQEMLDCS
ncbi:unnamed protein product [Polarella glacialis]|uniref:Uncharacterized protein n=1 Tax=Polarella glacialis TaxID=89957 RepID=A0A813JHS2_POLGL|nr:unnamed protein product [Polarella glacialis]